MNSPILFSVIMPTYNRAGLIGKAIESVINQKYNNWELLIVDDGSVDNTKEVINAFSDDRVFYIYQENQERSAARNNGIAQAKGDFMCFLDSDDYYLPEFLSEFERLIKEHNYNDAFYFCNTLRETSNGVIEKSVGADETFNLNYDFLLTNTIGTPRVCLPAEIAKNNLFDLTIKNGEDFELWMRLINDLEIKYNNVYTQVFLDHEDRSINDGFVKQAESAIELRIDVATKYQSKFTKKAYKYFLNQNNLKLARTYFKTNKLDCIKYSIRVLFSNSSSKKEAIFMMLKSI
jgi:glycosyltransferase involved in cell wall biosynthesis